MLKRILFIIVFICVLPIVLISAFTIIPMGICALFVYIIKGDEDDNLMDFILVPFVWAMNLPYKIMNEN